jgi:DNA-binding transcriptional regulator of glucitol operon
VRRFLTLSWLLRHAAMVSLVAAFLALGWWQLARARGGNMLSYGYAIEWPVFALFVIFVWTREIRVELRGGAVEPEPRQGAGVPEDLRIEVPGRRPASVPPGEPDPDVRAYNDYLAWLSSHPDARPRDYRTGS